jgi:D-3-phosphoglycerate dehydrogenase
MVYKVLIGSRSFGKFTPSGLKILENNDCDVIQNPYGHALTEDELMGFVNEVDAVITGMDRLTSGVIDSSGKLKVISKHGVGIDNIDIKAATKKKIIVTNIPAGNEECNAVADFTFALLMSLARKICEADENTKKDKWVKLIGSEVYGRRIGVIGGGSIGKAVVARAKGFGMDVLVYDIKKDQDLIDNFDVSYVDLDYLLKNSDFVTIHVPMNEKTRGMIRKKELELMKKSAYIINTARGGIIDEDDLFNALNEGMIAGAALDVFINEPPKNSSLLKLNNLIASPHIAAYTPGSLEALDIISAENVVAVLKGNKPEEKYIINKEVFLS